MKKPIAALAAALVLCGPIMAMAQPAMVKTNAQPDPNGAYYSGIGYWDGSVWRALGGNSSNQAYFQNTAEWDWQTEGLNLRNNQHVNTEFVSQVLDVRKFGSKPTLMISWAGGTQPLFVAVDFLYSSTVDSTALFRPRLGRSDPRGVGIGTMRMLPAGAVSTDSVTTGGSVRSTWAIPVYEDSLGMDLGWAPYLRVHIYSNASVPGVYAHLVGHP